MTIGFYVLSELAS